MNEDYMKDVATATSYFSSLMTAHSSFFNTIDDAYNLALAFVNEYPPSTLWGIEEDLEYEETLYAFYKENYGV